MPTPIYYPLTLTILNFQKVGSFDISIPQSDNGENLIFQIYDQNNNPVNCTVYTVALTIANNWNAGYSNTGSVAWTTQGLGIFTYTPSTTDFTTKGVYTVTASITESGTKNAIPTEPYGLVLQIY